MAVMNNYAFKASGEAGKSQPAIGVDRGTFAPVLWALSPAENANNADCQSSDGHGEAPTMTSDFKINDHKDAQGNLPSSYDLPPIIGRPLGRKETIHHNGTPSIEYTSGQLAVLHDTMKLLACKAGTPSSEEFEAMDPEEQGQTMKDFLGMKNTVVFARRMNDARQIHEPVGPAGGIGLEENFDYTDNYDPTASNFRSVSPGKMRDLRRQQTFGRVYPMAGTSPTSSSMAMKLKVFFEARRWDARVSELISSKLESSTPITVYDKHSKGTQNNLYQHLNDHHESTPVAQACESGNNDDVAPIGYLSAEEGLVEDKNEPKNPEHVHTRKAESDPKKLEHRGEYVNIMDPIEAPEKFFGTSVYQARNHQNLVKNIPRIFLEMSEENYKLREEIGCLKTRNTYLEQQQQGFWDIEEKSADLREVVDKLRFRNADLQEQIGDIWGNVSKAGSY